MKFVTEVVAANDVTPRKNSVIGKKFLTSNVRTMLCSSITIRASSKCFRTAWMTVWLYSRIMLQLRSVKCSSTAELGGVNRIFLLDSQILSGDFISDYLLKFPKRECRADGMPWIRQDPLHQQQGGAEWTSKREPETRNFKESQISGMVMRCSCVQTRLDC